MSSAALQQRAQTPVTIARFRPCQGDQFAAQLGVVVRPQLIPASGPIQGHEFAGLALRVRKLTPDKHLAAIGAKRKSCIRVPYFGAALQCLAGTELVLTITSGMTSAVKADRKLRLVKAPAELRPFYFLMAWHPRLNSDPRHVWLRKAMRSITAGLDT